MPEKLSPKDEWAEVVKPLGELPPKPTFDPAEYQSFKDNAEWKTFIQHAAEAALIPPVLVLVLGAALGWVVKGFRANEPRK